MTFAESESHTTVEVATSAMKAGEKVFQKSEKVLLRFFWHLFLGNLKSRREYFSLGQLTDFNFRAKIENIFQNQSIFH